MSSLQITWQKSGDRSGDGRPLLIVEHLVVRVGIRRVLKDVDMQIYVGDHIRVTGPNGCGKSTLLNAIAGVGPAKIESGRIYFDGCDITELASHERAKRGIKYMRQVNNVFSTLTVDENLTLALGKNGFARFKLAFPEWLKDLPQNKSVGQLSGGQKKKLAWAMTALAEGNQLALLDEPRAGLDLAQEALLARSSNTTMLQVEHD